MRLNIELTDVNDEMPLFGGLDENGRYSGSIAENLEPGAEFITVTATDKDEFPDFKKVIERNSAAVVYVIRTRQYDMQLLNVHPDADEYR